METFEGSGACEKRFHMAYLGVWRLASCRAPYWDLDVTM